jgi:hypothetical protein
MYFMSLVDRVYSAIETLRVQRGPYKLAMLYNSALNAPSNWNLIVSADWTDQLGVAEATAVIVHVLFETLTPEERAALARVTVLKTTDPFVRDMIRFYPVLTSQGGVPVQQLAAGDVTEGAGFVFYSQPEVAV